MGIKRTYGQMQGEGQDDPESLGQAAAHNNSGKPTLKPGAKETNMWKNTRSGNKKPKFE